MHTLGRDRRLRALDLSPVQQAGVFVVERLAPVQGATVVPHDEIAGLPLMTPDERIARGVRPQSVQQCFAFLEREPDDIAVQAPAEEQGLAPGFRVRAHQGVVTSRRLSRVRHLVIAGPEHADGVRRDVMDRLAPADLCLRLLGQRLVSKVHVREIGGAALRGTVDAVKETRRRRHRTVREVRMPAHLGVAVAADELAVLLDIGDDVDFRMFRDPGSARGVRRRHVEFAEAPSEGHEPHIVQILVSHDQHQVVVPRLLDLGDDRIVEIVRTIDAKDLGAERRVKLPDFDRHCLASPADR